MTDDDAALVLHPKDSMYLTSDVQWVHHYLSRDSIHTVYLPPSIHARFIAVAASASLLVVLLAVHTMAFTSVRPCPTLVRI
jgi:hypothetical protein